MKFIILVLFTVGCSADVGKSKSEELNQAVADRATLTVKYENLKRECGYDPDQPNRVFQDGGRR
jgi:hypothetical protein